jgi:peptidoglycan LD-endopeptidase LytH
MEARTFGAFALGFSAGAFCLCVTLWSTGGLRSGGGLRTQAASPPAAPPCAAAPPSPASTGPVSKGPASNPPPITAEPIAPPRVPPGELPALIVPVLGVDVKLLADSFTDTRDGRTHEALDIPAARGTPVVAAAEGNVVKLFHSKPGGTTVYQFDDSRTYCYYYAHLDRYARGLQEGTLLRQGEVLGYVGTTGNAPANAPHLHFAVFRLGPEKKWWKGEPLDPLPMFRRK